MLRTRLPLIRRQNCSIAILLVALAVCPAARAQHGDQPITVTDLLQIKQLGDVALSPDGRQVLYSVRSIVPTSAPSAKGDAGVERDDNGGKDYEYRNHLYLADPLRTANSRQLTRGDIGATDAAWHPDGDRIAFVRTIDGTSQIFILPLQGGEAYAVTEFESGAINPRWSPDGSRLLVASNLTAEQIHRRTDADPAWPVERAGRRFGDSDDIMPNPDGSLAEIRAWLDVNAAGQRPREFHRLNLHGEVGLEDVPTYRHWFVVDADSASAPPVLITRGYYGFTDADWTADGTRVIVSGNMNADVHPDRVWDTQLYTAAADGSGMQPFFAMDDYSVSSPAVAPDGNSVAFIARRIDQAGYAQNEIGVVPIGDSRAGRLLTLDFDRSASAPKWSSDGWHLYFTAASDGGFPLYRVAAFDAAAEELDVASSPIGEERAGGEEPPEEETQDPAGSLDAGRGLDAEDASGVAEDTSSVRADSVTVDNWQPTRNGAEVERLTSLDRGVRSFDVGSASIFYIATEVANPYELFASDTPFTTDRRLTDHNATWLKEKRISVPEARTLTRDSLEIPYWIVRPTFFDSTGSYPLLLQIHGGPAAMWGPGEASMWHEFQFFASRGYGIVFSNPRGSGGYGSDFRRANFQDWGAGPAGDVLAVAAEAAREPWLDAERQVVTGGSYAGYLTAWIVGHDHRFKAAVAQRGVYDLGTFLGEGNAWRLVPMHFGGYPWNWDIEKPVIEEPMEEFAHTDAADTTSLPDSLLTAGEVDSDDTTAMPSHVAAVADSAFSDTSSSGDPYIDVPSSVSEILIRNSPLTYVDQIRTPLLIIHGDQDLRTGVIQSELLYKSLKILDRPVEYVRYPNSGHELSRSGDPKLRMDRILRIYEFMERFIR